jgi:transposase/predicted XRE-type DNA-binding protein
MNKIREIIRLNEQCNLSQRAIARALSISRPVVSEYIQKICSSGLDYSATQALDDDALLEIIEGADSKVHSERYQVLRRKFEYFVKELKRTGVTLERLWQEYRDEHPNGYGYSQFCYHFQVWRNASELTMHIDHKVADKAFVDFAGKHLQITNRDTGEITDVEVFVSILGASQYTYVQAVSTQQKHDWISANLNALEYFGGVPRAIVPDCLKTAVTRANQYEPDINPEYEDFARHYQTVILPARPVRPKDKALVENAVGLVYSRIYAALRNRIFYSLKELNLAIAEELEKHNAKPMQRPKVSRKQLFLETEKSFLMPMPTEQYEFKNFKTIKAQFNYHVYLSDDKHYYSVPYRYRGSKVRLIYTQSVVEIFFKNRRITFHQRSRRPNGYTTNPDHMPSHHKFVSDWNPQRFINWARNTGEHVETVITYILKNRKHPEQAYKVCMGILSLARKYDRQRLDKACKRAISFDLYSYKGIKNILEKKLEDYQLDSFESLPDHANIRGNQYYSYGGSNDQ